MPFLPDSAVKLGRTLFERSRRYGMILICLSILMVPGRGTATFAASDQRNGHGKGKSPVSMVVRADHMLARNIENEITFSGHVHLVKGTLRLRSDDLIVYLKKKGQGQTLMEQSKGAGSNQRVETMVATGHVVIHTPRRVAYAGRAVYIQSAHLFVLTEDPVVIQNGDRMSGERITFFTRLNKSVIQGHSLMLLAPHRESSTGNSGSKEKAGSSPNVH